MFKKLEIFPFIIISFSVIIVIQTNILGSITAVSQTFSPSQDRTFFCAREYGFPVTKVRIPGHGEYTIIRWTFDYLNNAVNASTLRRSEERCQRVSANFQTYYDAGILRYMRGGRVNGKKVICVAQERGGSCVGVLFYLHPESDTNLILRQLFNVSEHQGGPLNQNDPIYVDITDVVPALKQ